MELNELLKNYREQIDTLDHEIIYLLSRRFSLVKEIWKIKKDNNSQILQSKRWNELMQNLLIEAEDRNVSKKLVSTIWNLIHDESLSVETKI